jgi:acyl-coenzyme A thioesterase PaaI-like protein
MLAGMGRDARAADDASLQVRFGPDSTCYGCGPANDRGLRLESRMSPDDPAVLVAEWQPLPYHAAFDGVLNGGVIGTLLDCHANWTAAMHLMRDRGDDQPPDCVTAEYAIRLRRPTPTDQPVRLTARVVDAAGDRAVVDADLSSGGIVTATCRGTFVAVGPDHPAAGRW